MTDYESWEKYDDIREIEKLDIETLKTKESLALSAYAKTNSSISLADSETLKKVKNMTAAIKSKSAVDELKRKMLLNKKKTTLQASTLDNRSSSNNVARHENAMEVELGDKIYEYITSIEILMTYPPNSYILGLKVISMYTSLQSLLSTHNHDSDISSQQRTSQEQKFKELNRSLDHLFIQAIECTAWSALCQYQYAAAIELSRYCIHHYTKNSNSNNSSDISTNTNTNTTTLNTTLSSTQTLSSPSSSSSTATAITSIDKSMVNGGTHKHISSKLFTLWLLRSFAFLGAGNVYIARCHMQQALKHLSSEFTHMKSIYAGIQHDFELEEAMIVNNTRRSTLQNEALIELIIQLRYLYQSLIMDISHIKPSTSSTSSCDKINDIIWKKLLQQLFSSVLSLFSHEINTIDNITDNTTHHQTHESLISSETKDDDNNEISSKLINDILNISNTYHSTFTISHIKDLSKVTSSDIFSMYRLRQQLHSLFYMNIKEADMNHISIQIDTIKNCIQVLIEQFGFSAVMNHFQEIFRNCFYEGQIFFQESLYRSAYIKYLKVAIISTCMMELLLNLSSSITTTSTITELPVDTIISKNSDHDKENNVLIYNNLLSTTIVSWINVCLCQIHIGSKLMFSIDHSKPLTYENKLQDGKVITEVDNHNTRIHVYQSNDENITDKWSIFDIFSLDTMETCIQTIKRVPAIGCKIALSLLTKYHRHKSYNDNSSVVTQHNTYIIDTWIIQLKQIQILEKCHHYTTAVEVLDQLDNHITTYLNTKLHIYESDSNTPQCPSSSSSSMKKTLPRDISSFVLNYDINRLFTQSHILGDILLPIQLNSYESITSSISSTSIPSLIHRKIEMNTDEFLLQLQKEISIIRQRLYHRIHRFG